MKKVMDYRKLELLKAPKMRVKMILDTDTYNEIDDQYALAYALKSDEKLDVLAVYAAPFLNKKAISPQEGMEKSYQEILNVLDLLGREDMKEQVFKGSDAFMTKPSCPIDSDAARDLVSKAMMLGEDEVLYVVAIGAITNVASAILLEPKIIDKIVVVWLGGNSLGWKDNLEFNCMQDKYAAKTVFDCGVPLVQLPCWGVTSHLTTTEPELRHYLKGKNELCDYLYSITCEQAIFENMSAVWSKEIWDIVTIAWLINEDWMQPSIIHSPIITLDDTYGFDSTRHFIKQIQYINRDEIFGDLFAKLVK
ncbi:MAG: nucleoside hydrolase [Turicibacter sp.]